MRVLWHKNRQEITFHFFKKKQLLFQRTFDYVNHSLSFVQSTRKKTLSQII